MTFSTDHKHIAMPTFNPFWGETSARDWCTNCEMEIYKALRKPWRHIDTRDQYCLPYFVLESERPRCHCGRPVYTYADGFTRDLCQECSTVRCDAYPGACYRTDQDYE